MKFYILFKSIKWRFKIHCIFHSEINYIFNLFFELNKQQNKIIAFDNSYNHTQNIIFFIKELKANNHHVLLIIGIVVNIMRVNSNIKDKKRLLFGTN